MQQDSQKDFDFFKELKIIENNTSSPLILKMWSMFLLTQYRAFKALASFSKIFVGLILVSVFISALFLGFNKYDTRQQSIKNHQIDTVKEIDSTEFAKIQSNLVRHKNIELRKMIELYWVSSFLNQEGKNASSKKFNLAIQSQMSEINKFYDKRQFELTQAYDFVNKGRTDLIVETYDEADPIEKIINWETFTKAGTTELQPDTIKLTAQLMSQIKDPVKLSEYLVTKKSMIDSGKIF